MIALDRRGKLLGIEVIAFYEPPEYKPHKKWLGLFSGKTANQDVLAGKDIPIVTGATLTTEAITKAVRIVRALWALRYKKDTEKGKP